MGSFPGAGYFLHHDPETKQLFANFLNFAGLAQQVTIDDHSVQARLHRGPGGAYLWITNPNREEKKVAVTLAENVGKFSSAEDVWGKQKITQTGRQFTLDIPPRDAVVANLR